MTKKIDNKNKEHPLVSIITASYNSAKFIDQTIESILAQTYTNWELLITDDCSTDNCIEIIQKYVIQDKRIKLFRLKQNSGAGIARNNSIREATGKYIAFCDSDDKWKPDKLEKQLSFMVSNGYAFTYTSYDVIDENNNTIGYVKCRPIFTYRSLLIDNGIGCLTSMYDQSIVGKMYMPSVRKRQDWGLWLRIIKKTKYAYGLQYSLSIYRNRDDSISSNKIALCKYNYILYHKVENFSALSSIYLLVFHFIPYYLYKKLKQKIIYSRILVNTPQ